MSTLNVNKWNIWHVYSSSVVGKIPSLKEWGKVTVDLGLASLAVHRDGECWYKVNGKTLRGSTSLSFVPNKAEGQFELPAGASDYAKECIIQFVSMRTHEQYVLADPLSNVPPYLRIYFEPSVLKFKTHSTMVYPQAKIYEDGVLLLQLRVLSGEHVYAFNEFIDEQVNLFSHQVTACELSREVIVGADMHSFCDTRVRLWNTVFRRRDASKALFRPLQQLDNQKEFPTRRISVDGDLWNLLHSLELVPINLHGLANLHIWALLDAAAMAERRRFDVFRSNSQLRVGNYWSGRPSIYISETLPRIKCGKMLVRDYSDAIASILLRSTVPLARPAGEFVGPNLRPFADYALFADRGSTLWFGLNDEHTRPTFSGDLKIDPDVNIGGFVYTKHVQVEFIEYWYIAHKVVEEKSLAKAGKLSELALMERHLSTLDNSIELIPPSGEIAEFIRHVGSCLNISRISTQIRANLHYKEVLIQEARDRKNTIFGAVLTIIIGLTGVSSLSDAFVQPLLSVWGWEFSDDVIMQKLKVFMLAFLMLLALLTIAVFIIYGVRRRKH